MLSTTPIRDGLRALLTAIRDAEATGKSADDLKCTPVPYPGLHYFTPDNSEVFIGRDEHANDLLARLGKSHIILVLGGSGCGKSSLVRGKALPSLSSVAPVPGRPGAWYAITFRPEKNPVERLRRAFTTEFLDSAAARLDLPEFRELLGFRKDDPRAAKELTADMLLRTFPTAGIDDVHPALATLQEFAARFDRTLTRDPEAPDANLLVVVDQFEEIFRKDVDPGERSMLLAMVRYIFKRNPPGVFLVLVMRSEDLHRCAEEPGLPDIVNSSLLFVDWLHDLGIVITEPARRTLASWVPALPLERRDAPFTPDLVNRLVAEAEILKNDLEHKGDHLPLLQHALQVLWRRAAVTWEIAVAEAEKKAHEVDPHVVIIDENAYEEEIAETRAFLFERGQTDASLATGLQVLLAGQAERALKSAEECFARPRGDNQGITGELAVRAAFCEMASLDENRRYYRAFRTAEEIAHGRFPIEKGLSREDLVASLRKGLTIFEARRLLSRGESGWDVTHEALLRNWDRLEQWVDEDVAKQEAVEEAISDRCIDPAQAVVLRSAIDPLPWRRSPIYGAVWLRNVVKRSVCRTKVRKQAMLARWLDAAESNAISLAARLAAVVRLNNKHDRREEDELVHALKAWYLFAKAKSALPFVTAVLLGLAVLFFIRMTEKEAQAKIMEVNATAAVAVSGKENQSQAQRALELWTLREKLNKVAAHRLDNNSVQLAHATIDSGVRDLIGSMLTIRRASGFADLEEYCTAITGGERWIDLPDKKRKLHVQSAKRDGFSTLQLKTAALTDGSAPLEVEMAPGKILPKASPGTEVCLSKDGTVMALALPGALLPQIFRLAWFRNKEGAPHTRGSIEALNAPSYVALFPSTQKIAGRVDILGLKVDRATGMRTVLFRGGGGEGVYEASFYDGYAAPVRAAASAALPQSDCVKKQLPAERPPEIKERCEVVVDEMTVRNTAVSVRKNDDPEWATVNSIEVYVNADASQNSSAGLARARVTFFGAPVRKLTLAKEAGELHLTDDNGDQWLVRLVTDTTFNTLISALAATRDKKERWSTFCQQYDCEKDAPNIAAPARYVTKAQGSK